MSQGETSGRYAEIYASCLQAAMTYALGTITAEGPGSRWHMGDLEMVADNFYRRAIAVDVAQRKVDWLRSQGKMGPNMTGIDALAIADGSPSNLDQALGVKEQ